MPPSGPSFGSDFRRFFFRGLGVLLPSVLTLWILVQAYLFVEARVAEPINRGIRTALVYAVPQIYPVERRPQWYFVTEEQLREYRQAQRAQGRRFASDSQRVTDDVRVRENAMLQNEIRRIELLRVWDRYGWPRFLGLLVAISLIYLAGRVLGSFIGRSVYGRLEGFLTRIPIFKQVYPHVKQLVDLILGDRSMAFKKVVLVEYPRKGIWTLAFVTGGPIPGATAIAGGDAITVFVPSTPTPFTGFTITVLRTDTRDVPVSVDEAVRFLLTGGVLTPSGNAGITDPIAGGVAGSLPVRAATAPPATPGASAPLPPGDTESREPLTPGPRRG